MGFSRRAVLVQGGVIGAGLIASDLPGFRALTWAIGEPTRKSLAGLAWNDPIVSAYRDAVGIMKAKDALDPLSWEQLGNTHLNYCPHGNWYFLPWHRAFVVSLERIVRKLTNTDTFAMPYWDWTTNPEFPEVFRSEKTPDNKPNHLYVPTRTWPMDVPFPPNVVGKDLLDYILKTTPYEAFGTSRPQQPKPQDSLDASWIRNGSGDQGYLEGLPHNLIHNDIGGFMPTMVSPKDPIFMMHHGNIDRIWAVWNSKGNANSTETNWKDMPFKDNFYNPDKSFWSPKVSDLFDPVALGYTYGLSVESVAAASPQLLSPNSKLTTVFAGPVATGAGVRTFAKRLNATHTRRLEISVPVDSGLLGTVAHRTSAPAGLSDVRSRQEADASGPRAYAFVRNITASIPENAEYRVFLKGNDVGPKTPTTDPHYVGAFADFNKGPMGKNATYQDHPSFLLDLTEAIVRVYGSISKMPKDLVLVIFALPDRPGVDPGTIAAGSIEIVIVTP
jgi:tyrosinase